MMKRIFRKRTLHQLMHLCVISISFILSLLIRIFYRKEIWLIGERYDEARDNGMHLFKYIRLNHPEKKVYYVISDDSPDRPNVATYGQVIKYRSLKHYFYYCLCKKHVSTHLTGTAPDDKVTPLFIKKLTRSRKFVSLQHGVTKDYMPLLTKDQAGLDLLVCSAYPEYVFVKEKFGYKDDEVRYLGMCRFDGLYNAKTRNQILLMPTFRMWFWGHEKNHIEKKRQEIFLESHYYKTYQAFINNESLIDLLEKSQATLVFYPHYEIQGFIHLFSTPSDRIIIADKSSYDVQALLKSSKLLVTDYSSVFFDFSYMRKPLIFYQFDYEEYRRHHYSEGYFSYQNHGFGPVLTKESQVIPMLASMIEKDYKMEEVYLKRVDEFFKLSDQNNTERNYEAIEKL
ncbi:teichoic acid biosynthesis protein B [Acidaminobacter sp. JC074]|uniref:CDP-glycerol glycerophosphotransferase family protein n=1 Tax=Acidaminobacter sp. JC074 TaxID=2530199 RepID=UPI001F106893|nr:CDP-glycerol glycerophosphotransferase family protein [Acidaminobacter sp. JC074]MCH4889714.1 teichoic acid biosynthesis protein B [Acidaminobacter sp. JC074]